AETPPYPHRGLQRETPRNIKPLSQEIHPNKDIKPLEPEFPYYFNPLKRINIRMEIPDSHAEVPVILGQVLSHPFCERRYKDPVSNTHPLSNLFEKVIYLVLG